MSFSRGKWGVPSPTISRNLPELRYPETQCKVAFGRYPIKLHFSGLAFCRCFSYSCRTRGTGGLLARSLNQRSSLGADLDPIADKLLLSSSFLILAFKKQLAWWLTILVLSRDVLILIVAVVILLISGYRPFPPSIYGKLTTATEIILVFLVVLGAAYPHYHVGVLNHLLVYTVTVLSIVSGFHYSFTTARHLSGCTPEAK